MSSRDLHSRLARRASRAGVVLDPAVARRLIAYFELLDRWNRKINLTALGDPDDAIDRLLLEPVLASQHLPEDVPTLRLIDIGSGGGSPAIPMTLAAGPRIALTMVEVKTRKSAFLREAIRHLELARATVENARFEELVERADCAGTFDVLSVRAVKIEGRVLDGLQRLVKPGGQILLFRGPTGPAHPTVPHPLSCKATVPLMESLRSRLTVLSKG